MLKRQFALVGEEEPSFGGLGVSIFFFLSGMLIIQSWLHDSNLKRFFLKRALRIFPALIVVVCLTVFVLGPIVFVGEASTYFGQKETWLYLSNAVLIIHHYIPGVFEQNPYIGAINGSLWTLPLEFICYITIAIAGYIGIFKKLGFILSALVIMVVSMAVVFLFLPDHFITHVTLVSYFWWGALFGYLNFNKSYLQELSVKLKAFLVVLLIVIVLLYMFLLPNGFERTLLLLIICSLVLFAYGSSAFSFWSRYVGDLSYGVYIYAFPVQQTLVMYFTFNQLPLNPFEQFCYAMIITAVLAYISWHFVESKSLKFKPRGK